MTFQTVEQMQDKINILEGAVSALEDAISAQAMSIKMLEIAAAQDERTKIVAWLMNEESDYRSTKYAGFVEIIRKEIEAEEHLK